MYIYSIYNIYIEIVRIILVVAIKKKKRLCSVFIILYFRNQEGKRWSNPIRLWIHFLLLKSYNNSYPKDTLDRSADRVTFLHYFHGCRDTGFPLQMLSHNWYLRHLVAYLLFVFVDFEWNNKPLRSKNDSERNYCLIRVIVIRLKWLKKSRNCIRVYRLQIHPFCYVWRMQLYLSNY